MSIFKKHNTNADRSATDRRRHKEKIEKEKRAKVAKQKAIIDESEELILKLAHLPPNPNIVAILNARSLFAAKKMFELMQSAINNSNSNDLDNLVISGKENLMDDSELTKDLGTLKKIIQLFDKKNALIDLLEKSQKSQGVQIFIGEESGYQGLDECSIVTSSYEADGEVIGTLGVIGPTRMAYERVIPIVDITAKLLSLNYQKKTL